MNRIQFLSKFFIILIIICHCIPIIVAQEIEDCKIVNEVFNKLNSTALDEYYKINENMSTGKKKVIPTCCDYEIKTENGNTKIITCNEEKNQVTQLDFRDLDLSNFSEKNLSEVIDLVAKLPNLTYISFAGCKIKGEIPSNIGQLKSLENLSFRDNNLKGFIPESLGDLTNLQYLDLSENKLIGNIPSTLGQLKSLKTLILNDNQISGSIPYSFKNLKSLRKFQLENTALSGYIPDLPNIDKCSLANSQICILKGTNNVCRGDVNNPVKICTEKQIKTTDEVNGRFEEEENKSHVGTILSIIGGIILVIVIAVIGGLMFIRKKRREERKKIELNRYNSQYYLNTLQNENSMTMDGSQVSSVSPILTPINKSMTRISIKNNDIDGSIFMRNSIIQPVSPVSPFLHNTSFVHNPSVTQTMNRSFTVNRMNSINSINRMNSYNSLNRMNSYNSLNRINSMNMNILANSSFTAGMNNDLYYMPNYVVVDQANPEHSSQGTLPTTLPFAVNHVNSINGHNIISVQNANEPIIPNRQMTLVRQKELTKEEEAKIDREKKKDAKEIEDGLPCYEDL